MAQEMNTAPSSGQSQSLPIGHVTYALFVFFLAIIGVIIAYIKKSEAQGILISHFQYLIRTFWIGLAGYVVAYILGYVLGMIGIGFLALVLNLVVLVWFYYRVIKGWLQFNAGKDIENPTGWL